ncbi:hypothetical protein RB195_018410 [Necator americanus]|uniref:Uncharacterized protein n=1 Tax=Necator americanus TaxID=51031 RepID=A0ABR1CBQ1_NECAM
MIWNVFTCVVLYEYGLRKTEMPSALRPCCSRGLTFSMFFHLHATHVLPPFIGFSVVHLPKLADHEAENVGFSKRIGEPGRDDIHSRRRGTDGFPMSRSRSTERVYLSALHAEKSRISYERLDTPQYQAHCRKTTDSMVVPRTLHEARHVAIMLFEPLARIEATGQPMPSIGTLNIVAF